MFDPQALVSCQAHSTWLRNVCSKCWIRPGLVLSMSLSLEPGDIRPWLVLHQNRFTQNVPWNSVIGWFHLACDSCGDNPFSSRTLDLLFISILLSISSLLVHLLILSLLPKLSHPCPMEYLLQSKQYLLPFQSLPTLIPPSFRLSAVFLHSPMG